MANWDETMEPYYLGNHDCLLVTKEGIKLPNELYIHYPELKKEKIDGKDKFMYKSRKGYISLWGGSVVENVVQALARIVVGEQMIKINEHYKPVLTVHDAIVCVVKKDDIDNAMKIITGIMSTPPSWGLDLPIACEAKFGQSYGDC